MKCLCCPDDNNVSVDNNGEAIISSNNDGKNEGNVVNIEYKQNELTEMESTLIENLPDMFNCAEQCLNPCLK